MQKDKILSYLGFCHKSAQRSVRRRGSPWKYSIKQRKAKLVIVSEEASQNDEKEIHGHV